MGGNEAQGGEGENDGEQEISHVRSTGSRLSLIRSIERAATLIGKWVGVLVTANFHILQGCHAI